MKKIQKKLAAYFKKGFSLIEMILGVTLFSIYLSAIFFGLSSLLQQEIIVKKKIYETVKKTDAISNKYYLKVETYDQ